MSDKAGVSVDCVIKTIYDKSLTSDLKTLIITRFENGIGKSSKLEVDDNTKKGFSLTATLELTKDDKLKELQLKGRISIAIMGIGIGAVTINIKPTGWSAADAGRDPKSTAAQAKLLVSDTVDDLVPKAVKAMEAKAP